MNFTAAILVTAVLGLPSFPIRGVLHDEQDAPVVDAFVFLYASEPGLDEANEPAVRAVSGPTGLFTIAEPDVKPVLNDRGRVLVAFKRGLGIAATRYDSQNPPMKTISLKLRPFFLVPVRVVDPEGKPLADADVRLMSFETSLGTIPTTAISRGFFARRTDAAGDVLFDVPDPKGKLAVRVESKTFGVQQFSIDGRTDRTTVRLRAVGKVSGRLALKEPKAAAGLRIRLESTAPSGTATAETRVDGEGRFEFPAVPAGDVRIVSRPTNDRSPFLLPEDVRFALAAGETKEVDVECVRGTRVSGKVLDVEANPIAGARLRLGWRSLKFEMTYATVLSDETGTYSWHVLPGWANVELERLPAPFGPNIPRINARILQQEGNEVEFKTISVRRGVPLAGTVVDEANRPVPHAGVEAGWQLVVTQVGSIQRAVVRIATRADDQGKFAFDAVDDSVPVHVRAVDATRASVEPLVIRPGADVDRQSVLVRIEPEGLLRISGRVVDANGKGLAGLRIDCSSPQSPSLVGGGPLGWDFEECLGQDPVLTDAEGRFEFPGLPRGLNLWSVRSTYQFTPQGGQLSGWVYSDDLSKLQFEVKLPEIQFVPQAGAP